MKEIKYTWALQSRKQKYKKTQSSKNLDLLKVFNNLSFLGSWKDHQPTFI